MALIRKKGTTFTEHDNYAPAGWVQPPSTELVLASSFDCKRPVGVVNLSQRTVEYFMCNLAKGHSDEHETFLPHEGRPYYWTSTRPHVEQLKSPIPEGESSNLKERADGGLAEEEPDQS